MGIEQVLGGFAKGFGQARMMKMQREKDKELTALQKQALQADVKEKDLKAKQLDLMNSLLSPYLEQMKAKTQEQNVQRASSAGGTGTEETKFGKGFGVADEMSLAQLMPIMSMIKGDYAGAGNLMMRGQSEDRLGQQFDWRKQNDLIDIWMKMQETHPGVRVPTEGGGESVVFPKKYRTEGEMPGAPKLTMQTKRPAAEMPILEQNVPLWINPETLESPPVGMSPKEAERLGFKRISSADKTKVNDFRSVSVLADRIENLMMGVFPSEESFLERIGGAASRSFGAFTQSDPNAALLKSLLDGTQAAFVRMFEKGTLTDQDIARAKKLNVSLLDDADVAWKKIRGLKEFIGDLKSSFVSGKTTKAKIPQAAIKKLKEGVPTKFGNGQVWTLENGKPVRME